MIDSGSATAIELRTFLEDNEVDLAELINSLVTTGEIVVKHLDGVEQVLVVYPYVVEGGFTVVAKDPATGRYDAHFGMVLTRPAGLPPWLREHQHATAPGRLEPADERQCPLCGACGGVERPWCRAGPAGGRRVPFTGRGDVRPRDQQSAVGRRPGP